MFNKLLRNIYLVDPTANMTNAELKALELLKEAAVEFPSLAMKEIIAQFNNVEVYQVDMTDINQELS